MCVISDMVEGDGEMTQRYATTKHFVFKEPCSAPSFILLHCNHLAITFSVSPPSAGHKGRKEAQKKKEKDQPGSRQWFPCNHSKDMIKGA